MREYTVWYDYGKSGTKRRVHSNTYTINSYIIKIFESQVIFNKHLHRESKHIMKSIYGASQFQSEHFTSFFVFDLSVILGCVSIIITFLIFLQNQKLRSDLHLKEKEEKQVIIDSIERETRLRYLLYRDIIVSILKGKMKFNSSLFINTIMRIDQHSERIRLLIDNNHSKIPQYVLNIFNRKSFVELYGLHIKRPTVMELSSMNESVIKKNKTSLYNEFFEFDSHHMHIAGFTKSTKARISHNIEKDEGIETNENNAEFVVVNFQNEHPTLSFRKSKTKQ